MADTSTINITDIDITLGKPYKVILFNDEDHGYDEVVRQVDKASNCGPSRAAAITQEAHVTGRAVVYTGHLERCEHVESVLNEIRLGTKIEEA